MPTGSPDYGAQPTDSSVSPSFDVGETTNHLLMGGGNISRSGRWFWASGFENGSITDFLVSGGTPPVVSAAPAGFACWQGSFCLVSKTRAISDDMNQFAKYFPASLAPGKWGIEVMFAMNLNTEIDFSMQNVFTAGGHWGIVRVAAGASASDVTIKYRDAAGNFQLIASPNDTFQTSSFIWHNAKLVYDFKLDQYVRFYLDGIVYNLPGVASFPVSGGTSFQEALIQHRTKAATISTAMFDNVILTADEP